MKTTVQNPDLARFVEAGTLYLSAPEAAELVRRHGVAASRSAGGFSPVHSKSLTALYFPNALSARAARHAPSSRATTRPSRKRS